MKNYIALLAAAIMVFANLTDASAQKSKKNKKVGKGNDPVVMKIGDTEVKLSEFEYVYNKNKDNPSETPLDEYIELYTNFRLKVKEAEELGMDTTPKFLNEFNQYKGELTKPYMIDKDVDEKLLREAYERMQKDVRASHILIKTSYNDLPEDTLKAYNRALSARKRVTGGEDFAKVAKEISDDPSAKQNGGDLGFFSVLRMVYPFESAAYNTKVGEVSMPVRTQFGYHILKVADTRKARGEIKAAHIMVRTKDEMSEEQLEQAKAKINEIKQQLDAGADFATLARKYSDDKGTATQGGELPWFGPGRMVPEFEEAAYSLQNNGDISEPLKSSYGWHIIKRIDKKDVGTFEDSKADLKAKIARDSRSQMSKEAVLDRIKKDYNFTEYKGAKENFYDIVDSTALANSKWDIAAAANLNAPLFKIADKTFNQQDFAEYIANAQTKRKFQGAPAIIQVNRLYDEFVNVELLKYEESQLPTKYPDYKNLLQEYRDGILIFNLTEEKVWTKSMKDTTGLKAFYEDHKTDYRWDERLDVAIYTCKDAEVANTVRQLVKDKVMKGELTNDSLLKIVNANSQLNLKIEEGKFLKGDKDELEKVKWEVGLSDNIDYKGQVVIVNVKEVVPPGIKTLKEARGLVANAYQDYLMEQWIKELKAKYPVTVYRDALKGLK